MDAFESLGNFLDSSSLKPENQAAASASSEWANDKEIFIRHAFSTDPALGCELLFKRYYAVLCSHALRFVYSTAIAEDIVGDVFTTFWERRSFENIKGSYRAYLFVMVRNSSLNYIKKEFGKGIRETLGPDQEILTDVDPAIILQADELNKLIERTIQSLPPRCQIVFLKSRLEGKKYAVIAAELNISVKAIEAQMARALDRLRKALQQDYLRIWILCLVAGLLV